MVDIDEVNEKINSVIEWLLNDVPLINKDTKDKLLDVFPLMSYYTVEDSERLRIFMSD